MTSITPPPLMVANSSNSDPTQSGRVTSGLNIIDDGINNKGISPDLYVHVLDGMIHVNNGGGTQTFSAGQFGYTALIGQPPVVLPNNSGIQSPIFGGILWDPRHTGIDGKANVQEE